MACVTRAWLRFVVWFNAHLKSAAVRLTKVTGKSPVAVHPKHLIEEDLGQRWYLEYVEPGMRLLDLGCGNAAHGIRAAERGAGVVAMEQSWRHLRDGELLSTGRGVSGMLFVLGDAEQPLPFRAEQFDLVLLLDVIEHLDRRAEVLVEIRRVLRPGGKLLVSAPNRDTRWKRRLRVAGLPAHTDPDHRIEYTWDELWAELGSGGFVVLAGPMPIVYDVPWAGLLDFVGGLSLCAYRLLVRSKALLAQRYPEQSSGWRVVCQAVHASGGLAARLGS